MNGEPRAGPNENAARWGPGAALEGTDTETLNNSDSTTNIVPLPTKDAAGLIEGKAWPLIPSGKYSVTFLHHELGMAFKVPRLFLHFRVVTPGDYFGETVYRAFRVRSATIKKRKGGAFKVSRNSDYVREMVTLLNLRGRLDRISPLILRDKVLQAEIGEVTRDHKQREIPSALQYSVVRKLICVEAGTP